MEILTHRKVYQLVGDQTSGSNECITKSQAIAIAEAHRKNVTSNLSLYLDNEYIDIFAVEDKPDLSKLVFATKNFGPTAAATTLSTTATSLDIDGYVIDYTATADVDWITNIRISGATITFNVADNAGAQRVGHITGINSASKSDTITITQEAYVAPLKYTYKLIAKNASGTPTITINGQAVTPTLNGSDYVYEYIMRVANESDAPSTIPFTIANGGTTSWLGDGNISVSPTSWELNNGLTKSFTVSYSDKYYEKSWDKASGTIARDGSTTTTLTQYSYDRTPEISYNISDNAPSGSSFTYAKSGMSFSATASGTSCAPSTITISYDGVSCTIGVTYTPDSYNMQWADGTYTKNSPVGMSSGTITDSVKTTKNGAEYDGYITASSDVDWLTVSTDGLNVKMDYTQNTGSSNRWGTITVWDSHNNSVSYNITQSYNSWSHSYKLVATGASSTPSMTINGTSVTPTQSGSTYTGTYTVTGTGTDNAPNSVNWSISGGTPSTNWGDYDVSVSPGSWNLDDGLSKSFSVSLSQSGTKYEWGTTSGTITKDSQSSTSVESSSTSYSGTRYSVSCPGSMTSSQNGMSFTATASSTSDTGTITVTCTESDASGESDTVNVYYTQSDYLVWKSSIDPTSVTFDYSGGTKSVTMKTWQEWANAGTVYGSVNTYTETITCSELRSETGRSWTEQFTHDDQTQKVNCTQTANHKIWTSSISPSSMTFTWEGGSQDATMKTWWWWGGSDTTHHDESTYTCTVTVAKNEKGGSGTESFTHDGQIEKVSWTQTARPAETWPDWDDDSVTYIFIGDLGTRQYDWQCNYLSSTTSDTITSKRIRTSSWGNTETQDVEYSEGTTTPPTTNNESGSIKTGIYSTITQKNSGKTLTKYWTQDFKPEEELRGPYYALVTDPPINVDAGGVTMDVSYDRYYLKGDVTTDLEHLTKTITIPANLTTSIKSGTIQIVEGALSMGYMQKANEKVWDGEISPSTLNFEKEGGSKTCTFTTWWSWKAGDTTKYDKTSETITVTVGANSGSYRTGSKNFTKSGVTKTVTWTQTGSATGTATLSVNAHTQGNSGYYVVVSISVAPTTSVTVGYRVNYTTTSGKSESKTGSVTISSGSSSAMDTGSISGTISNAVITTYSPSSFVKDGVTYNITD